MRPAADNNVPVAAQGDVATVLVIDDNNDAATWSFWFEDDARRRDEQGLEPRSFVLYGPVRATPSAANAAITSAFKDKVLPDIIVVDELLSTGGPYPQREAAGLRFMHTFRERASAEGMTLPPSVLWTALYTPGLAHAFVQAGGRHAAGRETPSSEFVQLLWNVLLRGETWTHSYRKPRLELKPPVQAVLPYFEADLPPHEIAKRLNLPGGADEVYSLRRTLFNKVNQIREQNNEALFEGKGQYTELARAALEHGQIWVPLAYRIDQAQ